MLRDMGRLSAGRYVDYDVTPEVTGDGQYTFELAPTSDDGADFSSREASKNRPQLVVVT